MTWLNAKTDWTNTDRYNFNDLNRVEINTNHVRDYLINIGYNVPTMNFVFNRTAVGHDTVSSINRLESNIDLLRESFITPLDYSSAVSWTYTRGFTYQDANRWEQSLQSLYDTAQQAFDGYRYAGTFISGQEVLLP